MTVRVDGVEPRDVVVTRLHPPSRHEQTVVRPRLMDPLTARSDVRLSMVAAPAGFGKSTLLAHWAQGQTETRPVGWLTMDKLDSDPVVLWSHMLGALQVACPELGPLPPPGILGPQGISSVLLPRLVNHLAEQGDIALILDDFH